MKSELLAGLTGICTYEDQMDLADFTALLIEKCAVRNVAFMGPEDFFRDTILVAIEKRWSQWLGPLVSALPLFETVISELRPQITAFISTVK